jgi:hypothetical protein
MSFPIVWDGNCLLRFRDNKKATRFLQQLKKFDQRTTDTSSLVEVVPDLGRQFQLPPRTGIDVAAVMSVCFISKS